MAHLWDLWHTCRTLWHTCGTPGVCAHSMGGESAGQGRERSNLRLLSHIHRGSAGQGRQRSLVFVAHSMGGGLLVKVGRDQM